MRKKILILGHNDATQFVDIYNQYTRLFDQDKYEVTVAFLTGEPNEETRQRVISEHILFLNVPKKDIRTHKIPAIRRLLSLSREEQYDLVICHRYKASYIMMAVNHFFRFKALICVMHELRTMKSFGRQMVVRLLAKENTLFAGVSNAVRDDLRRSLSAIPNERIVTLYNCIDIDLTEPQLLSREEARTELKLNNNNFIFGTVGRLVPNKDQASLIHAFSLIKPYCPNSKLILIGDGILEEKLKQQIEMSNLTDDVILTGFLPNGFKYMRAFDCFVLPSIQEAFGRVLIEAMIAKRPIIACGVNGIPEVVGDAGILVQPKKPVQLSQTMRMIYNMPAEKREKMGDYAYTYVSKNYSIPSFEKQFWHIPLIKKLKEQTVCA